MASAAAAAIDHRGISAATNCSALLETIRWKVRSSSFERCFSERAIHHIRVLCVVAEKNVLQNICLILNGITQEITCRTLIRPQ